MNLSGRKPRNGRLPMRALNKDWGTKLYVLGLRLLEGEDAGLELHLAGVRWADIDRVVTEVLHLEPGSWEVASLAQVEWYGALSPPSAQRLPKALGGVPQRGKGTLGRKEFLARAIPVDIPRPQPEGRGRPRAPLHGEMGIYRILNGATAVWKAELMVRVPSKGTPMALLERDTVRQVLERLLVEHEVQPVAKPSRWEPDDPEHDVWHNAPGPRLRAAQYRGSKPEPGQGRFSGIISQPRIVQNDGPVDFPAGSTGTSVVSDHLLITALDEGVARQVKPDPDEEVYEKLRSQVEVLPVVPIIPDSSTYQMMRDALFSQQPRTEGEARALWLSGLLSKSPPWLKPILSDLEDGVNGFVTEVSIPADIDPAVVVEGLIATFGEKLVLRYLGLAGAVAGPLAEAMHFQRSGPDPSITVIVIEPTVPEEMLLPILEPLREAVEAIEGRVIFVTHAGFLGSRRNAHEPRELRSTVYGARYWAHQRYRVAPNPVSGILEVIVAKDERHGRPGRRIFTGFGPALPADLFTDVDRTDTETGADAGVEFEKGFRTVRHPFRPRMTRPGRVRFWAAARTVLGQSCGHTDQALSGRRSEGDLWATSIPASTSLRCRVALGTESIDATCRTEMPWSSSTRAARRSRSRRGRPMCWPRALAKAIPARVLSISTLRSYSPKQAQIPSINRPDAEVESMAASFTQATSTWRSVRSVMMCSTSWIERPIRSSLIATTTSNFSPASRSSASRPGRLAFEPVATSVYSPPISQPRSIA